MFNGSLTAVPRFTRCSAAHRSQQSAAVHLQKGLEYQQVPVSGAFMVWLCVNEGTCSSNNSPPLCGRMRVERAPIPCRMAS